MAKTAAAIQVFSEVPDDKPEIFFAGSTGTRSDASRTPATAGTATRDGSSSADSREPRFAGNTATSGVRSAASRLPSPPASRFSRVTSRLKYPRTVGSATAKSEAAVDGFTPEAFEIALVIVCGLPPKTSDRNIAMGPVSSTARAGRLKSRSGSSRSVTSAGTSLIMPRSVRMNCISPARATSGASTDATATVNPLVTAGSDSPYVAAALAKAAEPSDRVSVSRIDEVIAAMGPPVAGTGKAIQRAAERCRANSALRAPWSKYQT